MNPEENKRILALSCIVADLKAENIELAQRVQQLVDEYNEVAHQLHGKDKRKDKDSSKLTLGKVVYLQARCYKLELENRNLRRFAKAMHEFVKDKNICMRKDSECPFRPGCVHVGSLRCLECSSCLGVIEGVGVICDKRLAEACAVFPSYD